MDPGIRFGEELDWLNNMHDWLISKRTGFGDWHCRSGNAVNADILM